MPLIRARQAESQIAQAEVLRFQDVEAEAQARLAAAAAEAERILAAARAQADKIKTDARKAGTDAGRAEGIKAGSELGRKQALEQAKADFASKHASAAKALAAALEQFEARRRAMLSDFERDVVALAGAIAARVVKAAVEVDPACLAGNIREALQLVAGRDRLEIRLNPQDLQEARQFAADLLPTGQRDAALFVADDTVGRGGALLRTPTGCVDATVETQWVRLLDEILAGWQDHWLIAAARAARQEPAPVPQGDSEEPEPQFVEILSQEAQESDGAAAGGTGDGVIVEAIDPSEVADIDPNNDAAE